MNERDNIIGFMSTITKICDVAFDKDKNNQYSKLRFTTKNGALLSILTSFQAYLNVASQKIAYETLKYFDEEAKQSYQKLLTEFNVNDLPEEQAKLKTIIREAQISFEKKRLPPISDIKSADELINVNCCDYLMRLAPNIPNDYRNDSLFKEVFEKCGPGTEYDPHYAYGNLYTGFSLAFEEKIEQLLLKNDIKELDKFKNLLNAIYANQNQALERSVAVVRDAITTKLHTSNQFKKAMHKLLTHKGSRNIITPMDVDSTQSTIKKYFAYSVKPQSQTSLPSIRRYQWQGEQEPKEYRFGTQGQYHRFSERINPVYTAWTKVNDNQNIYHLYINNLPIRAKFYKFKLETRLTKELHAFEAKYPHMPVITLPARGGSLSSDKLVKHKALTEYRLKGRLLNVISIVTDPKVGEKNDFKMSDAVRKKVFGEDPNQIVLKLLRNSFKAILNMDCEISYDPVLGHVQFSQLPQSAGPASHQFSQNAGAPSQQLAITEAQFQAVYFHFMKYALTTHIMKQLNPQSFNMSCFDAIDRGGVSSAYYNLIKSFSTNMPMSEKEFNLALHGASTMVKGRGMNHQIKLLWNVIDAYVDAHPELKTDVNKKWLVDWRDRNVIKESPKYNQPFYQLKRYVFEMTHRKEDYLSFFGIQGGIPREEKKTAAENILKAIEEENIKNLVLTDQDHAALSDARLKKIYEALRHEYRDLPEAFKKSSQRPVNLS